MTLDRGAGCYLILDTVKIHNRYFIENMCLIFCVFHDIFLCTIDVVLDYRGFKKYEF